MPYLCSAYKHSSPGQEAVTSKESSNPDKSNDETSVTATQNRNEEGCSVNSHQITQQRSDSSNDKIGDSHRGNCLKNIARFSLGFDGRVRGAAEPDQGPSTIVVRRVLCTTVTGSFIPRTPELSYAKYAQAFLCYVALNLVAAVFLGNKPIMPAFFASQFCGAMTIIYWKITGTLPI